jgi:carboxymethylenebutenolidase
LRLFITSNKRFQHSRFKTKMPDQPTFYDANSPNEQAPPLPSAPLQHLNPQVILQPPLSRRGIGPGLILLLPQAVEPSTRTKRPLDPEPVQKWAEEGFAVVGITASSTLAQNMALAVDALKQHDKVDIKDKIGLVAYDIPNDLLPSQLPSQVVCLAAFGDPIPLPIPAYFHACTDAASNGASVSVSTYPGTKHHFVLPNSATYDAPSANIAHTRTLVFLRRHIGGPEFDLEKIWEEHTYWEFERRSVAQTMATMVVSAPSPSFVCG